MLAKVGREKDQLLAGATSAKERAEIERLYKMQTEQARTVLAQLTDNVPPPAYAGLARAAANLRTFNFSRSLGSVILSQVADAGKIAMEHGVHRLFGALISDMATGFKGLRMSKKDARLMGAAIDFATNRRAMANWNATSELHMTGAGRTTKAIRGMGNVMSAASGMSLWTDLMETIASGLASTRILGMARKVAEGKPLTKFERVKAAQMNLTDGTLRAIAAQSKHWQEIKGGLGGKFLTGNIADWDDGAAADAFKYAVLRDVENSVITAGAQDVPTWMNNGPWGAVVSQFRKFSFAAVNKVLVPAMQNASWDVNVWTGIGTLVGLGAISVALRDLVIDGEIKERSTAGWVKDAVDRSGVLGPYFELEGLAEKQFGVSPSKALTGQELTRFQNRTAAEAALGPSAGLVLDVSEGFQAATTNDFTAQDLHRMRRLVPFQNLIWSKWAVDRLETEAAEALNLRDTKK